MRTTILFTLYALLASCATAPRGTHLDPETGLLVAEAPQPEEVVCRYEAPSGSNIRQKVCRKKLSEEGRRENVSHAMEQVELGRSRPLPAPRPRRPDPN